MEITLIYPYYTDRIRTKKRVEFPPLGLLYLASSIESTGNIVNVIPVENINDNLERVKNVDTIGFAITSSVTYPLFKSLRKKLEGKAEFYISGNCHTNIFPDTVLSELELDKVFIGESEKTIVSFLKNPNHTKEKIIGDKVDLNNIPFPSRHLLPDSLIYLNNRVGGKLNNAISMISSRGCLHNCTFCAVYNKKSIRYRSRQDFEKELKYLRSAYPKISGVVLLDENFTTDKEHMVNISSLLKKYKLPWECNSRFDTLNIEKIKILAQNDCKEIRVGLESGSSWLLKRMNKKNSLPHAANILKCCKLNSLNVKLYLMHGYPGENMSTTIETIDFLERNRENIGRIALYRFSPLPGSAIYNSSKVLKRSWEEYSIYKNSTHWFGSVEDYNEINLCYLKLNEYINKTFKI